MIATLDEFLEEWRLRSRFRPSRFIGEAYEASPERRKSAWSAAAGVKRRMASLRVTCGSVAFHHAPQLVDALIRRGNVTM